MDRFISYINSALPDKKGDKILYNFKKKTLDEMNARAVEVNSRGGITERRVLEDLIISEHSDLAAEYTAYHQKKKAEIRARRSIIGNIIGSVAYLLLLVTVFLFISMTTHMWRMTWIIVVDGVLLWIVYLLGLAVQKFASMKRIFHIFARIALFGAVVNFMVALFLFIVAVTDLLHSWLLVILGLILAFLCDALFATFTKAKLRIVYWLIYIPVIATFLFIIFGAMNWLAWSVAWLMIPLSLVLDLIIIVAAIAKNNAEKMEVTDIWKER